MFLHVRSTEISFLRQWFCQRLKLTLPGERNCVTRKCMEDDSIDNLCYLNVNYLCGSYIIYDDSRLVPCTTAFQLIDRLVFSQCKMQLERLY